MNQVEQAETHLNVALNIDDIRTNMITIEGNMLIIDLNHYSENALANLYSRVAGGYLSIRPKISAEQPFYTLVPENASKPAEASAHP